MADTGARPDELDTEREPTPDDVNALTDQQYGEEEPEITAEEPQYVHNGHHEENEQTAGEPQNVPNGHHEENEQTAGEPQNVPNGHHEENEQTAGEPQNVPNGHHEENEQPDTIDRNQNSDLAELNKEHTGTNLTLPELVQPPGNRRFSGSMGSNKDKGSSSDIAKQEHISQNNQRSTATPALSISAILNDVEFEEDISKTPDFTTSMDGSALSTYRSQKKDKEDSVKLPSITPRGFPTWRRLAKKRISNSPPKHYFEYRYILHNRIRLTKVFTKPPKFALLKSEANYIRMCKIIVSLGTMLLRDVLKTYMDRIYPPKDLRQFLQYYKRRLISFASTQKLLQNRSVSIVKFPSCIIMKDFPCVVKEWRILFDHNDHEVQLQELDPALIFWFLRHVCHFKKQTDLVWKWKPATTDLSIAADVTRIRDLRNGLINATDYALYEEEYERKIEEFKTVTKRLSSERKSAEMVELIKEMKTVTVKIPEREENLDILRKWADENKDRHIEKIAPSKQDWKTVKECKGMTRRFLKRFGRQKVFVKTNIYQQAMKTLLKKGFVILKGNTGEGKTTTALALMAALYDEDEVLVMSSTEHWKYVNKHSVGAILFDDLLGSMHFEEKQLTDWEGYFDEMYRGCAGRKDKSGTPRVCEICSGDKKNRACAKVIITMRKHVFDHCWPRLSKYKLFSSDNVVECSSQELTFTEKRSILSKHIIADHRIRTEVDKSAKLPNSKLGFPESCSAFVSQDDFLDLGAQFFERPVEILQHYLDTLYRKDMYGYLTLVVMMFQPGAVLYSKKLEVFTDGQFKKELVDLAEVCEVPVSDHLPTFCLMSLSKSLKPYVYYYDDIECYTFVHESIMEIMMSKFVERHPQFVLETCALQFIMDYVSTREITDVPRDQIFMMRMKKPNFLLLAQLFDHYMSYGNVVKIAQHRALRDPQFLRFFFNYIKQKNSQEEFILRIDKSVKEKDENRHVGFLYGAIDQDKPNVELAIAILKLGFHVKRPVNPEWCLSELRSSLCIAVKRRNFPIYSALVATKIDIPDKLMTEKEYLTSIDIVSDVLWKRPWSKEQRDIALVRASRLTTAEGSEIVSLLLQHGASVSSIRCETTALCEAVKSGNAKTVSFLLSSGASVYDRDLNDQSPLHHACDWNRVETTKLLLQKGADVNTKDTSGLSPFLIAAGWGREEIMQMLLTKRVDPLAIDELENTFLHICAANGRTAVMRAVISRFPDDIKPILIAKNRYGWTPLDFAMKCGHLGVTKLLVRTILQVDTQKPGHKSFVHTRFNIVKLEDLDKEEKCLHRFVDIDSEKVCFQIPRGKWYIEAGNQEEYDKVTHFVSKYEDRLKLRFAKS